MKKMLIVMLLCISNTLFSQTLAEWTQQKKTKKKYLLQQVAALKVYFDYVQKGYKIAHQGLTTIGNINNGDFNLHSDFFRSLQLINPRIKNSAKVADIISNQLSIVKLTKQTLQHIRESKQFSNQELEYCKKVFDHLLYDCLQTIDELVFILTSFQMTDDERLQRIDNLYISMQDKYAFAASFSDEAILLAMQRVRERAEVEDGKRLYNLK